MRYIKKLGDKLDVRDVGLKGFWLNEIYKNGIPVPETFFVGREVFTRAFAPVRDRIEEVIRRVEYKSYTSIEQASKKIEKILFEVEIPDIARFVDIEDPIIVRSSETKLEDRFGAGIFESYVGKKDEFPELVKRVYASAFSPRALIYASRYGISPLELQMGILIQEFKESESGGVMSTYVSENPSYIQIQSVCGLNTLITKGEIVPDVFIVDKYKRR